MTGEFPAQSASNAENVSNWWCHHELHGDEWLQMVAVDIHIDDCSNFIANGLELLQSCSNPSICTWDKCTWKCMCYCVTFRKLNCITPDRRWPHQSPSGFLSQQPGGSRVQRSIGGDHCQHCYSRVPMIWYLGPYSLSGRTSYHKIIEASRPRDWMLRSSYRSDDWQASQQRGYRGACQTSERLVMPKPESRAIETSRDLTVTPPSA